MPIRSMTGFAQVKGELAGANGGSSESELTFSSSLGQRTSGLCAVSEVGESPFSRSALPLAFELRLA